MKKNKIDILKNICYTELVYGRINKKLDRQYSKVEIEELIFNIIQMTEVKYFLKKGKNFYISNFENDIRITINSYTFRVITVDVLSKL